MTQARILIANRGEIACRIAQTCIELGHHPIAVFTRADLKSRHLNIIRDAHEIKSYLDIDEIVRVAKETKAEWVHPGYGFLSERSNFVEALERANIGFIGPRSETIEQMGGKIAAKKVAEKAKVPTLPWVKIQDLSELNAAAKKIGFPLLLKASAGGGGKGMRRVESLDGIEDAAKMAQSEAQSSFGDGEIFLERCLDEPRHIEVQVLGDGQGGGIHVFERECSVQRRHQKIWEEAPAANIPEVARKKMYEASLNLVAETKYRGAGTVEYLLDRSGEVFFLEMNTRLQVEHPVSEEVSRLDLVRAQLELALTGNLPEQPVAPVGHSIEVRIYAEDARQSFMPAPGKVTCLSWPTGTGIRVESGIVVGQEVGVDFDPMLAKLIVWAPDRNQAIQRMRFALSETVLAGVGNNIDYLQALSQRSELKNCEIHTRWADVAGALGCDELTEEEIQWISELLKNSDSHIAPASSPWMKGGQL